jgi:hypothetical protein
MSTNFPFDAIVPSTKDNLQQVNRIIFRPDGCMSMHIDGFLIEWPGGDDKLICNDRDAMIKIMAVVTGRQFGTHQDGHGSVIAEPLPEGMVGIHFG